MSFQPVSVTIAWCDGHTSETDLPTLDSAIALVSCHMYDDRVTAWTISPIPRHQYVRQSLDPVASRDDTTERPIGRVGRHAARPGRETLGSARSIGTFEQFSFDDAS